MFLLWRDDETAHRHDGPALAGVRARQQRAKAMYDLKFDLHFTDYPASVAAAGGLPVELTRDADVEGILARLDG